MLLAEQQSLLHNWFTLGSNGRNYFGSNTSASFLDSEAIRMRIRSISYVLDSKQLETISITLPVSNYILHCYYFSLLFPINHQSYTVYIYTCLSYFKNFKVEMPWNSLDKILMKIFLWLLQVKLSTRQTKIISHRISVVMRMTTKTVYGVAARHYHCQLASGTIQIITKQKNIRSSCLGNQT